MRLKLNVRIGYLWTIIGFTRLAERGFASSFCGAVDRLCYLTSTAGVSVHILVGPLQGIETSMQSFFFFFTQMLYK